MNLWRRGSGRKPRSACEELAEGVEFAEAPFGGGGQIGLDDREVGEAVEGAPAAAGRALLDLDWADVAFGLVGGEPDGQIGGEPQDHVLVVAKASGQPQPVTADLAAFPLVICDPFGDGTVVPGGDLGKLLTGELGLAGGAGGGGSTAGQGGALAP